MCCILFFYRKTDTDNEIIWITSGKKVQNDSKHTGCHISAGNNPNSISSQKSRIRGAGEKWRERQRGGGGVEEGDGDDEPVGRKDQERDRYDWIKRENRVCMLEGGRVMVLAEQTRNSSLLHKSKSRLWCGLPASVVQYVRAEERRRRVKEVWKVSFEPLSIRPTYNFRDMLPSAGQNKYSLIQLLFLSPDVKLIRNNQVVSVNPSSFYFALKHFCSFPARRYIVWGREGVCRKWL